MAVTVPYSILDPIHCLLKILMEHFPGAKLVGTTEMNDWILDFKLCTQSVFHFNDLISITIIHKLFSCIECYLWLTLL